MNFLGIPLPSKEQITSFFKEDEHCNVGLETKIERYVKSLGKKEEATVYEIMDVVGIHWGRLSDSEFNKTYDNVCGILKQLEEKGKAKSKGYKLIQGTNCCEGFHLPKYSGA